MIFSQVQYEQMKSVVDGLIRTNNKLHPSMAVDLDVEYDAMLSLFGQIFVRNLKAEIKIISEARMSSIVKRVELGESLVTISHEFQFGTFKFAKLYLEAIGEGNLPLSTIMTEPECIKDSRIRAELLQLLEMDPVCSQELELVKECLGREYEEMLISLLNDKKMCFETESQLRSRGKPKTPDILFLIPMATKTTTLDVSACVCTGPGAESLHEGLPVSSAPSPYPAEGRTVHDSRPDSRQDNRSQRGGIGIGGGGGSTNHNSNTCNSSGSSGGSKVVINWIDSKAMFADAATFRENLPQFRAYNNRYGRGMVIYWHGFVEGLCAELGLQDDMIIVRDSLPEDWIFPTGEPADGRTPAFDNIVY